MDRRTARPLVTLAAGLLTLAGGACASAPPSSTTGVTVVASFYPLAEAARRVGGATVAVDNLTPPGVEPHDLELSPKEIEAIATADVVLYLGQGFQPAVEDALGVATGVRVDLLEGIPVRPGPDEGSGDSVTDPHVWLDPTLMSRIVGRVATALTKADPAGAAAFAANARTYRAELAALDEEFRTGLASCARDLIVTSHAAFGYLADRYGLRQEPISGLSPEAEPDPRRLAELADLVRANGVTTIFTEELVSPAVADALARETGATTAVLDPLESLTLAEAAAGEDYLSVMRRNLAALQRGLGCAMGG
jgi:zinc transport system substrate-binding protein